MPEEAVRPKPLITGRDLIAAGYRPGEAVQGDAEGGGRRATGRDNWNRGRGDCGSFERDLEKRNGCRRAALRAFNMVE